MKEKAQMAITPLDLDNQERDLTLVNRERKRPRTKLDDTGSAEDLLGAQAIADLEALRGRISATKNRAPKDAQPHCGDCYRRGRAAAVAEIDGAS